MEPNQTMNESGIRIDLTKQNSVIYQQESLFQKALYDKLNTLLDAQWSFLQSIPDEQKRKISLCRIHNAILVYGERGSGKTVFISNIEENVKEDHYVFLDIVDPTLLSNSKVVDCCEAFCSILVGIVHEYLSENVFRKNSAKEEDKETYKNVFREVADCLSSLKTAKDESGMDSIFFHGNAIALEQKLHELFAVVSKTLLNGKMLCFRLDDVDMSFESGFLCLETIRKYFSSPWVIPIMCGDISLYQRLIEKEYLKSFFINDVKWMGTIARERVDFSSRYLTKVFPNNLRLEIVSCADFVKQYYNQISFVFRHKEEPNEFKMKDIDDSIDAYFNPGIGQDQYKNNALSSLKNNDKDSQMVVQDSLRVWIQFHEKMVPVYNRFAEKKKAGQDGKFDGNLYRQFQESLMDFFNSHQEYKTIAAIARINFNSTSLNPVFTYNYKDALTSLSKEKDIPTYSEGRSVFDRELRVSLASFEYLSFQNDKDRELFRFLLQLFSFDNSREETSKYLDVFSGRFVHLVFSTLFQKDCDIGEILSEIPPFCSLGVNAYVRRNDDDDEDDARGNWSIGQSFAGKTPDDLWDEIINQYPYVNSDEKTFFDVNFLQKVLALYYDNLNAYRKQEYDNESILDYMIRCVVMLLHSVYSCERKDLTTYKKIGLAKNQESLFDNKHKMINLAFPPEISLRAEKNVENSLLYYLYHHPLVQLIQGMAQRYFRKKDERSELKLYLPIVYLKKGSSESIIRQSIEKASSLDEVNDILMSVDKQTLTVISKFTQRSNAFKTIKMLFYKDVTSESSKILYDKICRTNNLTNLVPTSPAWEKCVIDD